MHLSAVKRYWNEMDEMPPTPVETLAREVAKFIPRQDPHGWELTLEEVSEVRTMLIVIKWLVGLFAAAFVAFCVLCAIMITDHVHIADMATSAKETRVATEGIKVDVNKLGNKVDNLEHRIAYYNRTDHPTVAPNED